MTYLPMCPLNLWQLMEAPGSFILGKFIKLLHTKTFSLKVSKVFDAKFEDIIY